MTHSLLHPTLSDEDLKAGFLLEKKYSVATVCIKPYTVKLAKEILSGTNIAACTVVGFPHESNTVEMKVEEIRGACEESATEIEERYSQGNV